MKRNTFQLFFNQSNKDFLFSYVKFLTTQITAFLFTVRTIFYYYPNKKANVTSQQEAK